MDPFITENIKDKNIGKKVLKELVDTNITEIEEFRNGADSDEEDEQQAQEVEVDIGNFGNTMMMSMVEEKKGSGNQ